MSRRWPFTHLPTSKQTNGGREVVSGVQKIHGCSESRNSKMEPQVEACNARTASLYEPHPCAVGSFRSFDSKEPICAGQPPSNQPLSCHRKGTRHLPALRTGDPGASTWSSELRHVSGKGGGSAWGSMFVARYFGVDEKAKGNPRKLLRSFWDSSG